MKKSSKKKEQSGILERVIENWLDSASERSYQLPFCYMLQYSGYTVLHSTRHCAMELGKDIIALGPDKKYYVFQLKGAPKKEISLADWNSGLHNQLINLSILPIHTASTGLITDKKTFLVTNRDVSEEVDRAITDLNQQWKEMGQPYHLHVWTRGHLLDMALTLEKSLWPSELKNVQLLLALFLVSGKENLDKENLFKLLDHVLTLREDKMSLNAAKRMISSAALVCAIAISNYTNEANHVAEIEAWTIYIACIISFAERNKIKFKLYKSEVDIAASYILQSLLKLNEELGERENIFEGDAMMDESFQKFRALQLLSMMSILSLWRRYNNEETSIVDTVIENFHLDQMNNTLLWGEAAVPLFLCIYWYLRYNHPMQNSDGLLIALIIRISHSNRKRSEQALPNPYYGINKLLSNKIKSDEIPIGEEFDGGSFTLEGIMHLLVRRSKKADVANLWPNYSRLYSLFVDPEKSQNYFSWRSSDVVHTRIYHKVTKEWEELSAEANNNIIPFLPDGLKDFPVFLILFICVFPHRFNSAIVRWIDSKLEEVLTTSSTTK